MLSPIRPNHPAIKAYHDALQVYADLKATHEGATETAFSRLLADTSKAVKWTLIPKESSRADGRAIIPDGTLRDEYHLRRGFWEAKDTSDDLDKEIAKKKAKKYPLSNTIFEDTRRAVLYQDGSEAARFDLAKEQEVADLLTQFYRHTEPEHDNFEKAVDDFKERVPDLAKGLLKKIQDAHAKNAKFQTAFDEFFSLCQTALNPNIRRAASPIIRYT